MSNDSSDSRFAWETIQRLGLRHRNGNPVTKQEVFGSWATERTRGYVRDLRTAMVPYLPDEILLNIFTRVDSHTLHRLCRTNRTYCNIAQPLLFCTFSQEVVGTPNPEDNLSLFLRTLIEQPRLALHVRHVKLRLWNYDDHEPLPEPIRSRFPPSLSKTLAPTYQSAITKLPLSIPTKERFVASFRNDSGDAEVALLVALCRNLETLMICVEDGVETSLLMDLARESLPSMQSVQPIESHDSHILKCLRELHVQNWYTEEANISAISPLLMAPNLHSLTADGLGCQAIHPRGSRDLHPHYLTLKHVHLRYCHLTATSLARILSSCPKLQTFSTQEKHTTGDSFEYLVPDYSGMYFATEWQHIGRVLRKHGQTLQTLHLSPLNIIEIEETDPEVEEQGEVIFPLGNLEPLNALTTLTAPQFALMGQDYDIDDDYPHFEVPRLADILPKSLESLAITHCSNDIQVLDKAIIELIADPRHTKLKRVCIERKNGPLDFDKQNAMWNESIEHWNDWYTGSLRMICRERVLPQ